MFDYRVKQCRHADDNVNASVFAGLVLFLDERSLSHIIKDAKMILRNILSVHIGNYITN